MIEKLRDIGIEAQDRSGRVVALPASSQDVAGLVGLARSEGWIVAPHWMDCSSLDRTIVGVSVERMSSVTEVVADDLMAVAGAGVTVGQLEERVAPDLLCWPPAGVVEHSSMIGDLISGLSGGWTLEGNLARRYLLQVEGVLADGSILNAGARTVKSVTGYDLRQLLVGSMGTLGTVTQLTLRLEAVANREGVLERYARDFENIGAVGRGGAEPQEGDGAHVVIERLKRELDPEGVFPPISAAWPGRESD